MEKIYSYLDIILLVLVVIFLAAFFIKMLGKRSGLERKDLKKEGIINPLEKAPSGPILTKDKNKEPETYFFAEGSLNHKLSKVKEKIKDFNLRNFTKGAKKAFELIITNFNKGDLEAIKPFVTSAIFTKFTAHKQQHATTREVVIEDFLIVDVLDAVVKDDQALIKVKFLTKQKVNNELKEINEVWSFCQEVTEEKTSIWKLSSIANS